MVEITMGKIIGHYKKVIFIICLTIFMLPGNSSTAAFQEDELFEKAYEYYLSYQPEKALEYCDIFLYNFPDSSAKDAVLFWKAKSLMQLKRTEEAAKIFSQMRETAPESPFVPFIDKELSVYKHDSPVSRNNEPAIDKESITVKSGETAGEEKIRELRRENEILEKQLTEINNLKQLTEKGLSKAIEDKNRLEALLEASTKNNEDLSGRIAVIESDRNAENMSQKFIQTEEDIKNLRSERDKLKKKVSELEDSNREITTLKAKADEQEDQYRKTAAMLQQLKDEKEALEKGIGEKDRKISEFEKNIAALNKKEDESLKTKDREMRDLTVKAEEQARERQDSEVLLKNLTLEKTATEERLKEKESRLSGLEEELKKERSRMTELTGKGESTERLAKELSQSEETGKKLQKQIDQYNEQLGIRAKEKETLLAKLKETEESAKISADSLQKLTEERNRKDSEANEYTRKYKDADNELNNLSQKITAYEKSQKDSELKVSELVRLSGERDTLQKKIDVLKAKADERENEYRKTAANLLQLKEEKEALEKGLEEKDRKIAESEKSIALLNEKVKEAEKERDREKQDTSQDLSRLSSEKVSIEDELKKKQRRIEELTAQVETTDNQLRQLRSIEELRKTKESDDERKQTEAELTKLQGERATLQEKSEELKTKDRVILDLTVKTEEQEREKQAAEALLKNLTAEKAVTAGTLKENESRLAALEEELKKERSRMTELTGKGESTERLAKELSESEETGKKLQKQIDQYNEQLGIRAKEKETLLAKLKETEESAKISADSLQRLTEAYEYTKLEHEKGATNEIASLKDIIKQYETPVLKIGENQFSLRQILDDHRESSEVMRKINAHNIIWRSDDPYNDFIIEHLLLKKARESGTKEDKALYNSLLKQYPLSEKEKDYLLRYLIINNLIKKKLSEIIADENLIRKDYESNKEKYIIKTEINQVKILSLKYSPQEELEKSLVAVDFQHQVSSGKSLETVYKYNSNVLSFDEVNVSDLPDFVKERVDGLKDGEMSNIISYDNKFMILQMQSKKKEYRSYEDVYKEFREKSFDDPTTQAHLLQEWFNELRKEAGSIK